MEILQMIQSSKRFTTFFVIIFIVFPVILIVNFMYPKSTFALFENLTKGKVALPENAANQNVTSVKISDFSLGAKVHNISDEYTIGTMSKVCHSFTPALFYGFGSSASSTRCSRQCVEVAEDPNFFSFIFFVLFVTNQIDFTFLNRFGKVKVWGKFQNGTKTEGGATTAKNNNASVTGLKNDSVTGSKNDSTSNDKDNLFDGLLASGFDEASCISRKQSQLYRKASPHKPSPYLISKLRNYEEIHRKCGPYSRAYNRDMKKILRSKNKASTTMCKYLIWTPANGLGNQMISMAATFLYALVTNRVLLVQFGKDKQGLFCEPFLNSTWLLPEKSPFWNEKHVQTYQSVIEKHIIGNTSKEHFSIPSILLLNLQYNPSFPEKFFHCDHSQDLISKVPLLILQSDQYFVPSLFMTPIFNNELNKMFPETDTVFHHLGRYLFQPSNEAWGLINNSYHAHLAKADEKIGLQIRVFSPLSTPQQTILNLVLNCTIENKLLPQVGVQSQSSKSPSGKNKTTKVVLVTSLYPEYGENLRIMYMNKPTVSGEVIEVYQPSSEGKQKFNDNKHNMKAWTDMYLLSLSDVLVTTSLSTFGYVAQGLGNLRPWLLYKLTSNDSRFPACERDFSMEPCYHAPPRHDCSGQPIKDLASSLLDLRRCKDYWFGVKHVDGSM